MSDDPMTRVAVEKGYLESAPDPLHPGKTAYRMTKKGFELYAMQNYAEGEDADTYHIALRIISHYYDEGCILLPPGLGGDSPEFSAYSYRDKKFTAIEIASTDRIKRHRSEILHDMKKWRGKQYAECHVWASSRLIDDVLAEADNQDGIRTFVVQLE